MIELVLGLLLSLTPPSGEMIWIVVDAGNSEVSKPSEINVRITDPHNQTLTPKLHQTQDQTWVYVFTTGVGGEYKVIVDSIIETNRLRVDIYAVPKVLISHMWIAASKAMGSTNTIQSSTNLIDWGRSSTKCIETESFKIYPVEMNLAVSFYRLETTR